MEPLKRASILPNDPNIDPEVGKLLEIIGSPINFMEHTSRGLHVGAHHLVFLANKILAKLRAGNPMARTPVRPGDQQFLGAFLPVRHGKSFFTGRYLAPWLMGVFPGIKILFVTYSDERASRWGGDARDLMKEWAPSLFGCHVRKDRESANLWALSNGSEMRCVGIGGAITGEGAHVIIIDDTVKNAEEADSPTTKRKQVDFYYETLRNRLEPGGLMLCIVARWREDDLAGSICIPADPADEDMVDDWEVLRLPALAEAPDPPKFDIDPAEAPPPPDDWTDDVDLWVQKWAAEQQDAAAERWRHEWRDPLGRADGDALWPERWSQRLLLKIRNGLLKRGQATAWEALYQQNPTPKEGGSFKVDVWRRTGKAPALQTVVRFWDLSASQRKGDWTVGVKMGLGFNNEVYVLHVARDRLDPAGVQNLVVATAAQDGYEVVIGMEEETGASGKSNSAMFAQKLMGYQFHPERASGKKDVRAAGYAAHQGNGNVYLVVDGTWDVDAFIEEHRVFGAGRHDDQVDAAAGAFRMLVLGGFGVAAASFIMPDDDLTPVARRAHGLEDPLAWLSRVSDESDIEDFEDSLST